MLRIRVRFHDSLSNSFAGHDGESLFTSFSDFKNQSKAASLPEVPLRAGGVWREEFVRELNRRFPEMPYRVVPNYENTVLGVIARLMGEIRRVKDLEPDHPARRFFAAVQEQSDRARWQLVVEAESDEIFTYATAPLPQQTGGAGVIRGDHPLYDRGPLARLLFGHLGQDIRQIAQGGTPAMPWTPGSPSELIARLGALDAEQLALQRRDEAGYQQAVEQIGERLVPLFARQGVAAADDLAKWSWAGAGVVAALKGLTDEDRQQLMARGGLSQQGNVQGIAMSGNVGRMTPKDIYKGAGADYLYSTQMPYGLLIPRGRGADFVMGAIVKSGRLDISCDVDEDMESEVRDLIEAAAVGPFVLGKRGLAYLESMEDF